MEDWMIGVAAGGGLTIVLGAVKIGMWVGAVNENRSSFKELAKEIRDKLDKILERLAAPTSTAGSPLRLTEFGEKISRELQVREWARNEATGLLDEVQGREPYEVQDFCMEHVQAQFDLGDEFHVRVRAGAYENGTTVKSVQDVFVIELREALLGLMEIP
jgi:hypothetical protein